MFDIVLLLSWHSAFIQSNILIINNLYYTWNKNLTYNTYVSKNSILKWDSIWKIKKGNM